MQAIRLDDQRAAGIPLMLSVALDAQASASATLLETLEYLNSLQDQLWQSARNVPSAPADGASPAVARIRRARQAAAIQGAVNVLKELAREASSPLPIVTDR